MSSSSHKKMENNSKTDNPKKSSEADMKTKWLHTLAKVKSKVIDWCKLDTGWSLVTQDKDSGATIYCQEIEGTVKREVPYRENPKGYIKKTKKYKIWKCVGEIQASMEMLISILTDIEHVKTWNTVVHDARVIEKVDAVTDVALYTSNKTALSSRDFVALRRCEHLPASVNSKHREYLITSIGIVHPKVRENEGVVRGFYGPGGFYLQAISPTLTRIVWIINIDPRVPDAIPQLFVDKNMKEVAIQLVHSVKDVIRIRQKKESTTNKNNNNNHKNEK